MAKVVGVIVLAYHYATIGVGNRVGIVGTVWSPLSPTIQ